MGIDETGHSTAQPVTSIVSVGVKRWRGYLIALFFCLRSSRIFITRMRLAETDQPLLIFIPQTERKRPKTGT